MRRAIVICEGQTEEAFISRVLVPPLLANGLYLQGITVNTSPGHKGGATQTTLQARLQALQDALHADIVAFSGCNPARFIPHIQPNEFEALLFSDVQALAAVEAGWTRDTRPSLRRAWRPCCATPATASSGTGPLPPSGWA